MEHELKIWPEFFQLILNGRKTFEVRRNDRNFKVGDTLLLREYNIKTKNYGSHCRRTIIYIMHGGVFGIKKGYCVMGIQ